MIEQGIGQAQWRGAGALAQREVTRVLRLWSQTIAPNVVSAVLFIAILDRKSVV